MSRHSTLFVYIRDCKQDMIAISSDKVCVGCSVFGLVLGRSSIIIDKQSFTSLIMINRLQNWQSITIAKKVTPSGKT